MSYTKDCVYFMDKKESKCTLYFSINILFVLFFMGSLLITAQPLMFVCVGYLILMAGWYFDWFLSKFKYSLILFVTLISFIGAILSIPFEKVFM